MALQPIDLQVIFSQTEKVGKEQSALKDGAALQRSIAFTQDERKNAEKLEAVNETTDEGMDENRMSEEGVLELHDDNSPSGQKQRKRQKKKPPRNPTPPSSTTPN
jgi:hypothetical protein